MSASYPVEPLLDTRFVKVFDLQYAPGRHYYDATRRPKECLVAAMNDIEYAGMIPDAVSCCVIMGDEGKEPRILLNREYRYPIGRTMYSVPAGLIDPEDRNQTREEAIRNAARRELFEETGIRFSDRDEMTVLNPCLFSTPGFSDESNAMVRIVLRGHTEEELTQSGAEETEKIDGFVLLNKKEAAKLMQQGGISTYTWIGLASFLMG